MKKCNKCGLEKELTEFHYRKKELNTRQPYCKKCKRKREIFENGYKRCSKCKIIKELTNFYKIKKGFEARCIDCCLLYQKQYKTNNYEKIKEYTIKTKETRKIKKLQYRNENKEKIQKYSKQYKINNKHKTNEYIKNKRKNDINFKLICCIKSKIRQSIKKNRKTCSTIKLLGCTIEYFKIHIESLFKTGMTWENHGLYGWHIDHIRPCASFDLTDPEQQRQCFHYSNCQPLWATENLSKGSKIE